MASIPDSDGGRWDGDTTWDRAVGPMQFLPGTWRSLGRDGNGDRVADPNNLFDAAVSAAGYLCLSGGDLSDPARLRQAVYGYNHSWAYVDAVLGWARLYQGGVATGPPVPSGTAPTTAGPSTTGAPTAEPPPTTGSSTTTRPATTTTRPPTTTTRPPTTTTRPPTTTAPPTTGSSTTTTTAPCQSTTTTTTTTGEPTTTTSTTTTTTLPGGSTTTTTTLPPCG